MTTSNCIIFSPYFTLILEVWFDVVIKSILPKKWPYFISGLEKAFDKISMPKIIYLEVVVSLKGQNNSLFYSYNQAVTFGRVIWICIKGTSVKFGIKFY